MPLVHTAGTVLSQNTDQWCQGGTGPEVETPSTTLEIQPYIQSKNNPIYNPKNTTLYTRYWQSEMFRDVSVNLAWVVFVNMMNLHGPDDMTRARAHS